MVCNTSLLDRLQASRGWSEWTVEGVVVVVMVMVVFSKYIFVGWVGLFDIRFSFKDLESFEGEVIEINEPRT